MALRGANEVALTAIEPSPSNFCPNCGTAVVSGSVFCANCGRELGSPDSVKALAAARSVPVATTVARAFPFGAALVVTGGALGVIGSFLPWIQATAAFVGTISRNGLDGGGDGTITLVAGIVIGLFGIARLARSGSATLARLVGGLAAVAMAGLAILDIGDVSNRVANLGSTLATGSVGMGLYVIVIGGVLGTLGSLLSEPTTT